MGDPISSISVTSAVVLNSTAIFASPLSPNTPSPSTPVISDSGANSTFFRISDSSCLCEVRPTISPITAFLSNGTQLISTHEGLLNLDFLPLSSRHVHIFADASLNSSLIGIGIFTDAGFRVIYDSSSVQVVNAAGDILLHGTRDLTSKLWVFEMQPHFVTNNILQFPRHADRVLYYNRCFCSCANSTMEYALKSKILVIPDLPVALFLKNMPNQVAQASGHLDRTRRGLRSTTRAKNNSQRICPLILILSNALFKIP